MPRPYRTALFAVIAALVTLVPLFSACGGDSVKAVDADDWVDNVCERFVEYDEFGLGLGEEMFQIDLGDAEDAKKEILKLFAKFEKEFDDLESDFKKMGKPDIDGGAEVREAFLAHFKDSRKRLDDTIKDLKALDTDSKDFEGDVNDVFANIDEKNFRDALDKLADKKDDVQEVIDLIDENPDCVNAVFNDDADTAADDGKAQPTPTKKAGTAATTAPGKTPSAGSRTTPKANATKNEKFVIGLCVAMTSWLDDTTALADALSIPPNPTAKQAKDAMVAYFEKAHDLTVNLKKQLAGLPVPDGKDGKAIHEGFAKLGSDLERSFAEIVTKIKAIDPKTVAQVQAAVEDLSADFDDAMLSLSMAADAMDVKYDTDALSKIADSVPECEGVL